MRRYLILLCCLVDVIIILFLINSYSGSVPLFLVENPQPATDDIVIGTLLPLRIPLKRRDFSIFLADTSTARNSLTLRCACAVESAAKHHPDVPVTLFVTHDITSNKWLLQCLKTINNVQVTKITIAEIFEDTPLFLWYHSEALARSPYQQQHLSDAIRMAIMWKHGGVYLDTDMIVIRPLDDLIINSFASEGAGKFNLAAMHFDSKHPFMWLLMEEFVYNYDPMWRDRNGPILVTETLLKICNSTELPSPGPACGGVNILPKETFYAISWWERELYFKPPWQNITEKLNNSYAVHLWNWFTHNTYTVPHSGHLLDRLAHDNCPKVYEFMDRIRQV